MVFGNFTNCSTISGTRTSRIRSAVPCKIRPRLGILGPPRTCSTTCGNWTSQICSQILSGIRSGGDNRPCSASMLGVLWQTNLSHDGLRSHDLFTKSVLSQTRQSSRSWSVAGAQVNMTTEDKEATVNREVRDTSEDWKPILVSHSHSLPRTRAASTHPHLHAIEMRTGMPRWR